MAVTVIVVQVSLNWDDTILSLPVHVTTSVKHPEEYSPLYRWGNKPGCIAQLWSRNSPLTIHRLGSWALPAACQFPGFKCAGKSHKCHCTKCHRNRELSFGAWSTLITIKSELHCHVPGTLNWRGDFYIGRWTFSPSYPLASISQETSEKEYSNLFCFVCSRI